MSLSQRTVRHRKQKGKRKEKRREEKRILIKKNRKMENIGMSIIARCCIFFV